MAIVIPIGLLAGYLLNVIIKAISEGLSYNDENVKLFSIKDIRGSIRNTIFLIKKNLSFKSKVIDVLVIAVTVLLFSISFYRFGMNLFFIEAIIMMSVLIVVSFVDFKHQIIPDTLVVITLFLDILFSFVGFISIKYALLGMLIGGAILFILALAPGALGGGDIKFIFAFGGFLGPKKILWAIMIAFAAASVISILLLVFKVKGRKDHIPFGPFLALGCIASFLFL